MYYNDRLETLKLQCQEKFGWCTGALIYANTARKLEQDNWFKLLILEDLLKYLSESKIIFLGQAFPWIESPQGYPFWKRILKINVGGKK